MASTGTRTLEYFCRNDVRGEYVVVLHDRTKLTSGRGFRETLHALLRRTR